MLFGRASERQILDEALSAARVGDSRVLVVTGEPGIGKTALLTEALDLVGPMRVLRAQGVESEQYVPFAGLLQLVRPLLPLLRHIPAPQARALSSALLLEATGEVEPSRFAVGAATLSLLCRAAEDRSIAVLLDDAHLLDSPTVEALVFAARRLVSDAVALIAVVRSGDPGAAAWAGLPSVHLRGLDLDAAADLITSAAGRVGHDLLVRLHAATAGNPLALVELGAAAGHLGALPPEAPLPVSEQLSRSFLGRYRELDDAQRSVVLVAAADSTSLRTVRAAAALLGNSTPDLFAAEDAGLVTVEQDRIRFRHPLVRSAIYSAADRDARRRVHRALAEVIPQAESARLAWHLSRSAVAPDEATAQLLDRAAREASLRGAHAIAAAALERAAELSAATPRVAARLAAAGEAAWLAGQTHEATTLLDRALGAHPQPQLGAHIQALRAAVETRAGSLELALSILTRAAAQLGDTAPETTVRLLADAVHVSFYLADPAAALAAAGSLQSLLGSCADRELLALGQVAIGMALVLSGAGAEGIERLRGPAYELAARTDTDHDRFQLPLRLQGALWVREADPDREMAGRTIERLREQAALGSLPYLLMQIARDAATSDRWSDAEAAYQESIRLARETGQTTDLAVSLAGVACLYARQGRAADCRDAVCEAEPLSSRNQVRLASIWQAFALGDLASGTGDQAEAARHYEALETLLESRGLADPDQSCVPELVETYLRLRRVGDARTVAARFDAQSRSKGQPWSLARAERALALCAVGTVAEGHFRAALELHDSTPDRYETARTQLAFGAALRRDRRRVEARPLLRSALATFEELGAKPWADRAAQELQASGETARRRQADGRDDLTPQERQIAQHLAQGRTTREVAAALFLSPKTVEYHLRHVYLKLGIRTRDELARTLDPRAGGAAPS